MPQRKANLFQNTVDGIIIRVPEFTSYREISIDAALTLCPNSTPARQESPKTNNRAKIEEMRRRFERHRDKEEKLLVGNKPNLEDDEEDEDEEVFENDGPLQMRVFEPSSTAREDISSRELPSRNQIKKSRKHRRRRSGSFTGGVYPRKGHRNRSLLGYAIPPPNVHSSDWKDMLAITDNKDRKLEKILGSGDCTPSKNDAADGSTPATASASASMTANNGRNGVTDSNNGGVNAQTTTSTIGASVTATSAHVIMPGPLFPQMKFIESNESLNRHHWIMETFTRRECSRFIASSRDFNKCGCGRPRDAHRQIPELTSEFLKQKRSLAILEQTRPRGLDDSYVKTYTRRNERGMLEKWSLRKHTVVLPTNAFGQIEFQGGPHPYKAQYVRLNFDTEPAYIMSLFEHVWQITPPRLIITVHGGTSNFDLQPKLARVFRKGLLKAASTTGAWIITSGCDTGVVRHVAAALEGAGSAQRNKIVCIGISPWGLLKKRDELIGVDKTVAYYPFAPRGRFTTLNNRHSYFLLVDNGTVGRYGAEVILRKRLETYISQKQKIFGGTRSVPVVCVVLEGGSCTIRSVLDYVTSVPRVPVVVCDGSGRAADLLAFAHQNVTEDGLLHDDVRRQVLLLVEKTFGCSEAAAQRLLHELVVSAQHKNLLTIFRLGEKGEHDVDHAILTALLKGHNLSPPDQLALALAWNRVDIARSDIFYGEEWEQPALQMAMMEALIHDRVDFVRLLLEQGTNMQKFLTISRLDELYNTDKGPPNTLYYIIRDVVRVRTGYRYKLPDIGLVIEKLMGNAYKSTYTSSEFREKYKNRMKKMKMNYKKAMNRSRGGSAILSRQSTEAGGLLAPSYTAPEIVEPVNMSTLSGNRALSNHLLWRSAFRANYASKPMRQPNFGDSRDCPSEFDEEMSFTENSDKSITTEPDFRYPFSELLIWAVLTKRQEMAMCMWQHGEEAMAKALVACRLYKSLATEAAEDYLEVEICEELKKYAEEFRVLSLELLDHCYHQDDAQTLQLLTYELSNWSNETCLALSVFVNNKHFLAHPCCQILLADLWHGGLRMRTHSNIKVVAGLIFPLTIQMLEFKTREELLNQPQTAAEHEQDLMYSSSSSSAPSSSSSSSDSSTTSSDDDDDDIEQKDRRSRKQSQGSVQSLNIATLFQSRRRKAKKNDKPPVETDVSANEAGRIGAIGAAEYGTFGVERNAVSPPPPYMRKRTRYSSYRNKSDDSKASSIAFGSSPNLNNLTSSNIIDRPERPKPGILEQFQGVRQIKLRRRYYEFYTAPITTFWAWAISFAFFIIGMTFVLLVKTPREPTWLEWLLFAYVVAFGMELIRKMLMSDAKPILEKLKSFFFNYWNSVTMGAIVFYIIGFLMRAFGDRQYGRVVLACDSVLWTMKLLDYMSVHPKLGPYVTMAGKMIQNMSYIIVMLVVTLLSFGLARQSITYPQEDWHWILVRNIFLKPYFMLYGEVYADEIDTCGDEAWDRHLENGGPITLGNETTGVSCVPGYWIPPLLMTFFLLIANILLMSMLIAIFNHIFDQTDEMAQQIWLFQRYRQVMEYESTPFVPPPLTPLYHIYMIGKYVQYRLIKDEKKRLEQKHALFDFSLKLFLTEDQIEKLHDFEEDCMEDLARQKHNEKHTSNEQRIQRTDQRSDQILTRLMELQSKESMGREVVSDMDTRLATVEKNQTEILEMLRTLTNVLMPSNGRCLSPMSDSPPAAQSSFLLKLPGTATIVEEPEPETQPKISKAGATTSTTANTDLLAPGPVRRSRTATICGGYLGEDGGAAGILSPKMSEVAQRLVSVASMDPLPKLSTVSIRRRHEEYTSITDSIAIRTQERRLRNNRSNSSDHAESPAESDVAENLLSPPKNKRSTRDLRLSASRDDLASEKISDRHFSDRGVTTAEDEEAQADCELTDVLTEEDENEEEEEEYDEDEEEEEENKSRRLHAKVGRIPSNSLTAAPSPQISINVVDEEEVTKAPNHSPLAVSVVLPTNRSSTDSSKK